MPGTGRRGDSVHPAHGFRQAITAQAVLHPLQLSGLTDEMLRGDKQRITAQLTAQHPAELLPVINQGFHAVWRGIGRCKLPAQALFRHADSGRHPPEDENGWQRRGGADG